MQDQYFPSTKKEALAFLYIQSQDLSHKTPEEILAMYDDAYEKIDKRQKESTKEKKEQRRSRDLSMF